MTALVVACVTGLFHRRVRTATAALVVAPVVLAMWGAGSADGAADGPAGAVGPSAQAAASVVRAIAAALPSAVATRAMWRPRTSAGPVLRSVDICVFAVRRGPGGRAGGGVGGPGSGIGTPPPGLERPV
jgi:hypothetical protein